MTEPLLVIDVAHPPRPQRTVEEDLQEALDRLNSSRGLRVLKIVHGYGASGKGGTTKAVVQNWLFRRRESLRKIIPGESYGVLDPGTQVMRAEVGQFTDRDLGAANRGITVVWVR